MIQFLFDIDSLQDSVRIKELDSAFVKRMDEQNFEIPFIINRLETKDRGDSSDHLNAKEIMPAFNEVTVGFRNPITYRLTIDNKTSVILKRIAIPVLFSIFLVAFTALSFWLLYRNLLRQNRLGEIKNEFISNITHELKTPIATVSVAIEALRSFNANIDAQRTKEYLDISANELQRLSLLVDKVLKLSMFEKREIDLQYEPLDMRALVQEVASSLRLQLEKHHAQLNISSEGNTTLEGDRLHLLSVVFNLLDNAIKYSKTDVQAEINITSKTVQGKNYVSHGADAGKNYNMLSITDNGIGFDQQYSQKIFELFQRLHNKNEYSGTGIGLAICKKIIQNHQGFITANGEPGKGATFHIFTPLSR